MTRTRRKNQQMDAILEGCRRVIAEEERVSLRHLFYRLVGMNLLDKTEREYSNLGGYTMKWRRSGVLPWYSFIDSTRYYHGRQTFNSMEENFKSSMALYRKNLWATQPIYVEIWVEKEAIAPIAMEAASEFNVKVFAMKGYPSGSALFAIAHEIRTQRANGKEVFIYYLGDHDPSGVDIQASIGRNLAKDFDVEINIERLGVTPAQIQRYQLPTRPTKKSDSRSAGFKGDSVEVDALDRSVIEDLVKRAIIQHIDPPAWERALKAEQLERETMTAFLATFRMFEREQELEAQDLPASSPKMSLEDRIRARAGNLIIDLANATNEGKELSQKQADKLKALADNAEPHWWELFEEEFAEMRKDPELANMTDEELYETMVGVPPWEPKPPS